MKNALISLIRVAIFVSNGVAPTQAAKKKLMPHPSVGQMLVPKDVDWENPIYETYFLKKK